MIEISHLRSLHFGKGSSSCLLTSSKGNAVSNAKKIHSNFVFNKLDFWLKNIFDFFLRIHFDP